MSNDEDIWITILLQSVSKRITKNKSVHIFVCGNKPQDFWSLYFDFKNISEWFTNDDITGGHDLAKYQVQLTDSTNDRVNIIVKMKKWLLKWCVHVVLNS